MFTVVQPQYFMDFLQITFPVSIHPLLIKVVPCPLILRKLRKVFLKKKSRQYSSIFVSEGYSWDQLEVMMNCLKH